MPRSLSNERRVGIVDRLRNNKTYALSIAFMDGDVDAANYARDLATALAQGGWVVSGPFPVACGSAAGVHVEINDVGASHPGARLLMDVLIAVGIDAGVTQGTSIGPNHYRLVIGAEAN
jgi:hypothetical protein